MITCSLSWPYLQNIYPNLPQYIKNTLPIEEVTKYDTQANYFYQIRTYIDPLGKEVYKDIIRTILKNDWMSICYRYPMGILHYSYPHFIYITISKALKNKDFLTYLFHGFIEYKIGHILEWRCMQKTQLYIIGK